MKKLYIFLLCAILCAATLNAQTWNCGDPNINGGADVTATLDDGTLTTSGAGDMANDVLANLKNICIFAQK